MTLFDEHRLKLLRSQSPLATRMRPKTLDEIVGQEHLLGKGKVFRRSIELNHLPSMILWGPTGAGKTTLAFVISSVTNLYFEQISAVTAGVSDLRRIIQETNDRLDMSNQGTILFIDEIHRFSKSQQSVILPYVENGTVILIGATTENPSFEIIGSLLSRCQIFPVYRLTDEDITLIVNRGLSNLVNGIEHVDVSIDPEAMVLLLRIANGDARVALNATELAFNTYTPMADGSNIISLKHIGDVLQEPIALYDKNGDQHYGMISAYIKSVRASDPDAAIYWLSRMIEGGEPYLSIARRMIILASEDIGLADPQGLSMAVAAYHAVHFVGMPEGAIPLAEATVYLATAPKSNSIIVALRKAKEDIGLNPNAPIPPHLINPVTPMMLDMGYGENYENAHDYPGHFSGQMNLPQSIYNHRYYDPSDQGYEKIIAERIRTWWRNCEVDS